MRVRDTCCEEFIFEERKIVYVLDHKGTIWIRSKEIEDILLYSDREDITQRLDVEHYAQFYSLNPNIVGVQEEIEFQTIFLNQNGIHRLVSGSEKPNKLDLSIWIANTFIPSIRELERKFQNEKIEELKIAYETANAKISGLMSQIKAKSLELKEHYTDAMMMQRYVQLLREEKRASDASLELQIKDAEAMQHQIQVLIAEKRNKVEEIEEWNIKIRNMEWKFRKLETENQSKNMLLDQAIIDKNNMQSRIQDLEIGNQTKDETLEQNFINLKIMHNDMIVLKRDNGRLNLQAQNQKAAIESYEKVMRKQDVLLHLLKENFIPKPYDKKLENQFLIFNINEEDFFKYYAVSIQNSNLNRQIKTIRTRHPNSVELLRLPFYPNAVDMISLLKNHLKDKIRFRENYFELQMDDYTDDDLKKDVFRIFKEAENTREQVFTMMCIERDFRSTENKCSSIANEKANTSEDGNNSTLDLGYESEEERDNSTVDSIPPLANETSSDSRREDNPESVGNTTSLELGKAGGTSSEEEGDKSTLDSDPPLTEPEDNYSDMFPYRDIVHEANA